MNNEKMDNEFDEQYKEQLGNLPEEKPSREDWELLREKLQKEGLINRADGWKKYFLVLLLAGIVGGGISVPLFMNRYSIDLSLLKSSGQNAEVKVLPVRNLKSNTIVNSVSSKHNSSAKEKVDKMPDSGANNDKAEFDAADSNPTGNNKVAMPRTVKNENGNEQNIEHKQTGKDDDKINKPAAGTEENPEGGELKVQSETKPELTDVGTADAKTESPIETAEAIDTISVSTNEVKKSDTTVTDTTTVRDTSIKDSGPTRGPWLGVFLSWDNTSYRLREQGQEGSELLNSPGIEGQSSFQYTVGVMGGLMVSKKFAIELGIFYSQKKKLEDFVPTSAIITEGIQSYSDFTYRYNARYIETYGRVKYYFLQSKKSFYMTGGLIGSFNFPVSESEQGYFESITYSEAAAPERDRITFEASSMSLSLAVSVGMEVTLSNRWNLFFEPAYRHALHPVIKHPSYDRIPVEHFWSTFSLATGLFYKF